MRKGDKKLLILMMPILMPSSLSVPERLKEIIIQERFEAIAEDREDEILEKATLAEVAAYLSGLSLEAPLDSDYAEIFLYCGSKVLKDCPQELRKEELSDYQKSLLEELALKIREKTLRVAKERVRKMSEGAMI